MRLRSLLPAVIASLLTAGAIALAQQPGVNNNFATVWTMVWESSTTKPTYSATTQITTASNATDVCAISGSSTKTIRIRRLIIAGLGASAVTTELFGIERYSGGFTVTGTPAGTAMPAVANDSTNPTATASVEQWSVNPVNTNSVGLSIEVPYAWANSTTGLGQPADYDFGIRGSAVVLRGASQWVSANLLGQVASGQKVACTWTWTEESP